VSATFALKAAFPKKYVGSNWSGEKTERQTAYYYKHFGRTELNGTCSTSEPAFYSLFVFLAWPLGRFHRHNLYMGYIPQTHTASYYETKPEENARQVEWLAATAQQTQQIKNQMTTANKKRNKPRTTHISHKITQNSERVLLDGCNVGILG